MLSATLLCTLLLSSVQAVPLQPRQAEPELGGRATLACFDIPNPLEPHERVPVACMPDRDSPLDKPAYLIRPTGTAPALATGTPLAVTNSQAGNAPNAFEILLDCVPCVSRFRLLGEKADFLF